MIGRSLNTSLEAGRCRGSRSNEHGLSWRSPQASAFKNWHVKTLIGQRSGGFVVVTNRMVWMGCCPWTHGPGIHPGFPPLQRAQIVELACLEPIATGLHITHWTSEDLARQAVAEGIVAAITPRTVRQILRDVDLQPHRTRYWKTSHLDAEFKDRTEKVLWCYANTGRLVARGIWVVCVDEMPNLQVLERHPIRRAKPGLIEHQEFEYTRHGTVDVVLFLVVHTGRMEAFCLDSKSAHNYTRLLQRFRQRHHHLKGIFLIQDNDPTHIAQWTADYFSASDGWWRPRFIPVHASWLNQSELLNHAFSDRYLKRRSFKSRREYIDHINVSWPEYNRRYAHPFEWTWTNPKMRKWYAEHSH
jgi:hypothetical protein